MQQLQKDSYRKRSRILYMDRCKGYKFLLAFLQ